MKNKYLAFLAILGVVFACTKPDDIINDFQVHVTPEFYSYVIQLNVEDLTDPAAELPSDLNVEVAGAGSTGVYYSDGTKNFAVNNGVLQMFIAREFEPSEGTPTEFSVTLTADGYRSNTKRFVVQNEMYSTEATARLLNLNNLPSGVSSKKASGAVDPATNALSQPLSISAASNDSSSSADITIPAGVKFLDADGNIIVGKGGAVDLNVNVLSVSDTSESG